MAYEWDPGTGVVIGKTPSVVSRSWMSPCIAAADQQERNLSSMAKNLIWIIILKEKIKLPKKKNSTIINEKKS